LLIGKDTTPMPRREESFGSSAIGSAGYDDDTQTLDITFTSGQTYTFSNVPPDVFDALVSAPSPGRFYHQHIKGIYG
jgi:hypothetical protein